MVTSLLVRSLRSKGLRTLGVKFHSKLTYATHLCEVVSKAAKSLGSMRQAGMLFDCPRVLNCCFNAFVLSHLEYCAFVWSHLQSLI